MNKLYSALVITLFLFTVTPIVALGQVQSWDVQLKPSQRFSLLKDFNDEAVLDDETGLVWEQAPEITTRVWAAPFVGAVDNCYLKSVGGRMGWRLPTMEELSSLVDETQSAPPLPLGHPFSNVQAAPYWTATTDQALTTRAWLVDFTGSGGVAVTVKAASRNFWCVRGGQGYDGL